MANCSYRPGAAGRGSGSIFYRGDVMRTALKKHAATLAVALCLVGGVVFSTRSAAPNADSVYYGGKIYTMTDVLNDSGTPDFSKLKGLSADKAKIAEVVAAKNGKIVFVGSEAEATGRPVSGVNSPTP